MLRALESGDVSDTTVSAALDALRESGALSLLGAIREVLATVESGLQAREIAGACSTIEDSAPYREQLLRECRAIACVPTQEASTVFVISGDGAPSAFRTPGPDSAVAWGEWQVYVGARWLLRRDEELTALHKRFSRRALPKRGRR
jgi:hypothetical protein